MVVAEQPWELAASQNVVRDGVVAVAAARAGARQDWIVGEVLRSVRKLWQFWDAEEGILTAGAV